MARPISKLKLKTMYSKKPENYIINNAVDLDRIMDRIRFLVISQAEFEVRVLNYPIEVRA